MSGRKVMSRSTPFEGRRSNGIQVVDIEEDVTKLRQGQIAPLQSNKVHEGGRREIQRPDQDIECPLCFKKLTDKSGGITHVKSCKQFLPPSRIADALQLYEEKVKEWENSLTESPSFQSGGGAGASSGGGKRKDTSRNHTPRKQKWNHAANNPELEVGGMDQDCSILLSAEKKKKQLDFLMAQVSRESQLTVAALKVLRGSPKQVATGAAAATIQSPTKPSTPSRPNHHGKQPIPELRTPRPLTEPASKSTGNSKGRGTSGTEMERVDPYPAAKKDLSQLFLSELSPSTDDVEVLEVMDLVDLGSDFEEAVVTTSSASKLNQGFLLDMDMDMNFQDTQELESAESSLQSSPLTSTSVADDDDRPGTPMTNYSDMDTSTLKEELRRYGLKPSFSRSDAKILLRHIYTELHKN